MVAKKTQNSEEVRARFQDVLDTLREIHADELDALPDSVEDLVNSLLVDDGVDKKDAARAIAGMKESFVDWNETRVAHIGELARLLDPIPESDAKARRIRELLNRIFDRTGGMNLSHMREMKVGEARRALMEIEPVSKTVADRILSREVEAGNPAVSPEVLKLAKRCKLIGGSGTRQQLQKALCTHLGLRDRGQLCDLMEYHVAAGCTKKKCPLCK